MRRSSPSAPAGACSWLEKSLTPRNARRGRWRGAPAATPSHRWFPRRSRDRAASVRATLPLRLFAALCAALGIVPLANLLAAGKVPWWASAVRGWIASGVVVAALCAVLALLLGARIDAAAARLGRRLLGLTARRFSFLVAGVGFVVAVSFSYYSFA